MIQVWGCFGPCIERSMLTGKTEECNKGVPPTSTPPAEATCTQRKPFLSSAFYSNIKQYCAPSKQCYDCNRETGRASLIHGITGKCVVCTWRRTGYLDSSTTPETVRNHQGFHWRRWTNRCGRYGSQTLLRNAAAAANAANAAVV